jgi:hypothetical protein
MEAHAGAQNTFGLDANRLPPVSNKQSDNDVIPSFAYSVNRPGNRRGRMPWKAKK